MRDSAFPFAVRPRPAILLLVVLLLALCAAPGGAAGLPDTGQNKCYDDQGNEIPCPAPVSALGSFPSVALSSGLVLSPYGDGCKLARIFNLRSIA